jgi:hypothetical protein
MAITVISGLVISTFLTLFVIPSIYTQVNRLRTVLGGEEFVVEPAASNEAGPQVAPSEGASYETS